MASATIQDVLRDGFARYRGKHKLPWHVIHAVNRMIGCRTSALGGHVERCRCGHLERVWYNSCKHRSCPQCSYLGLEKWLDKQRKRVLSCSHYHTIFTVPDKLNNVWAYNRRTFADLLFASVRNTLMKLLGDEEYLGAEPGMIMALHTWGGNLFVHPHIHCLVTGGGLTRDGKWRTVRKKCLLPRKVLMIIFRGKFLDALRKAARKGDLQPPPGMRQSQLIGLLNKLGRRVWNVKILDRYDHAQGVLTYLGRYLRGGPISNGRLISFSDGEVKFRGKNPRELDEHGRPSRKPLTLSTDEFIHRLVQHIPPPRKQTVRNYGLYANNKAVQLSTCRELLGEIPLDPGKPLTAREALARVPGWQEELCPKCGGPADIIRPLPKSRAPPGREAA